MKDLYSNLDLNLLRTFLVIYQEQNLQKASNRLFVTAPALSKSLTKLRNHFDDPLFVKVPTGLSPTHFATELYGVIEPTFDKLSKKLNSLNQFDPAELEGKITVAISPILLQALGKDLFSEISRQAPNVELHLPCWNNNSLDELANGTCKVGINYELPFSRKDILSEVVGQDLFGIYVRKDHPLAAKTISLADTISYPLALLLVTDWNIDEPYAIKVLREYYPDVPPKIAFRSELPSPILEILAETDLLFPYTAFFHIERYPNLTALDIKKDQLDKLLKRIHVYYPNKDRFDPVQQWLMAIISNLLNQLPQAHNPINS
ncbi:LysR family transcriptional regulator [Vibrio owensii]|uniref:LysR family transcriptional regulator n=1 Tax=Vibrio owensii TaxID=696485 RepID=UPI0009B8130B|nr:LysR family transcriptional regulator [Vibrio owensii]